MLGIEVDNKLTFSHHIDQICANGKHANNTLSALNNLKIDLLTKLYKILPTSRFEYGTSTPTEDFEIELKVIPVDLRLIQLQRKESYKILLKEKDEPSRLLVEILYHLKIQESYHAIIFKDLVRPLTNSSNLDTVTIVQRK